MSDKQFFLNTLMGLCAMLGIVVTIIAIKDYYYNEGLRHGWAKGYKTGKQDGERIFD
jgi:hypothetical protein